MFCPLRGWCPTVWYHWQEKSEYLREVCNTEEHKICTLFMSNELEDIVPFSCLCSQCSNLNCLRHPNSVAERRIPRSYQDCLCPNCQFERLCFPVVVAEGEEEGYIESLSRQAFERLMTTLNLLLFRASPYSDSGLEFPEPLQALLKAAEKRRKVEIS